MSATERNAAAAASGRTRLPGWAELAIVLVFTLLVTLPFIYKPIHMDDAGFMEFARARQDAPLEIVLEDYTFFGQENDYFIDTHPPLTSSYLALLIYASGGETEPLLHLGFLIFPLIAAASMYFLARLFTRHAMWAALLLMATPGVMVMSHGLMSDIPGLSLWLASLALYLHGLRHKSLGLMGACAIVITLGVLTSYQVLSVIPLLLAYAILRRELSLQSSLPFVLPLSTFISYGVWHWVAVGFPPRFSYGVGEPLAWYSVVQKGGSALLTLGGAMIFFAILMRVLLSRRWDTVVYLAFLAPLWAAFVFQYMAGRYTAAAALASMLFLPLGILLLYRIYADGWERFVGERRDKRADTAFLLLWLTGVLFYVVMLLPYSSVRYLLPAFPPLILLFIRLVEERFTGKRIVVQNLLLAAVVLTALGGILVAEADYELAVANRHFARNEAVQYSIDAASTGNHVWFVGEFGYRYYMEEQGFRELPKDRRVPEGDIILQSPLADPRPFSDVLENRVELVEVIGYRDLLPLRVTSFKARAGFYGHFWGLLPFSFASGNVEEYLVYRVVPPAEADGDVEENDSGS